MDPLSPSLMTPHNPRYSKRNLGSDPISGRPRYGWTVQCACGWGWSSNENKPRAVAAYKEHVRKDIKLG
jgi:hypothetical protein